MVHKKSEYRRTFCWRNAEECHAIWEENWLTRQRLKLQEYQHAPFAWENSENGSDDEESISNLPPSKLRLKYEELKQLESDRKLAYSEPPRRPEKQYSDKEVQTPPWNAQNTSFLDHVSPDKAVQTDISMLSSVRRNLEEDFKSVEASPSPVAGTRFGSAHCLSPRSGHVRKVSPSPHRSSGSKSPFVPYGWADKTTQMGTKRTFNVNASKNVYPSALQARQHKQEIAKLSKSSGVRSRYEHSTRFRETDMAWTSEYRKSFCRAKR